MTERMYMCGHILGIEVLDHIILGKDTYFSFSDNGLVFREPVTASCMKNLSKEFEEEPEM